MDELAPEKVVKISGKRRIVEPQMTMELKNLLGSVKIYIRNHYYKMLVLSLYNYIENIEMY